MHKINIANQEFAYDAEDPDGFRAGMLRLGKELGASRTGTSLYELPPGQSICPYHYEYPEEEWLIVLHGRPTLRHPEGVEQLEPWDIVFFPAGPDGAHAVRNDTAETVRVLMYSTVSYPAVSVYPDSDKVGVWVGDPEQDVLLPRSAAVSYYHGEQ
jgi:uncharacterized cupin superfamily protein